MIKVDNRKVVAGIAADTYKAHWKRNIITVSAILMTTFLTAVVFALGFSYWNTVTLRTLRMNGMDYDVELSEPRPDQVDKIRAMEDVEAAGVSIKCAILERCGDIELDKTQLYWLDGVCWEKQCIPALEFYEGSYPERKEEIMLSESALTAMGIEHPETGMRLSMEYYPLSGDGNGKITSGDFILSGYFRDYTGRMKGYVSRPFLEESGAKQTDFTQGTLKISLKKPLYTRREIEKLQQGAALDRQVIKADYDTPVNFRKTAAGLAVMLFMVLSAGYLSIYNTLYISISKDIRYYGQLKTIGMTSMQLTGLVYRQALWNALAGIPVGLLAGRLLAGTVVPAVLRIVNPTLAAEEIMSEGLWVYVVAGSLALFTDIYASRKPAKMAGDCAPAEAIRYVPVAIGNRRPYKTRHGKGGVVISMAWRSLLRDKKQFAVIFLSFLIAGTVFLTVNTVILQNDARSVLNATWDYDIRFKNETTLDGMEPLLTEEKIKQVRAVPGVKSVRIVSSADIVVPLQEEVFGDYYQALYQSRFSPGNYEKDMAVYREQPGYYLFMARLIGIDGEGFERLNARMGNVLEEESFKAGKCAVAVPVIIDAGTEARNSMMGKTVRFLPAGDLAESQEYGGGSAEAAVRIAAVGDSGDNPAYFGRGYTPDLIVSREYAGQLLGTEFIELIEVDYEKPFAEDTERRVKEVFAGEGKISRESKLERYVEMKKTEMQVRFLGNGIGFLIALLAVFNYIHMMAAGVQNRSGELAALESIGMTQAQLKQMLMLEGAGYALLAEAASLAVGLPVSYAVFQGMNRYHMTYSFPWTSHLAVFTVILVLCILVPSAIYSRTQRGSVIERLKNWE